MIDDYSTVRQARRPSSSSTAACLKSKSTCFEHCLPLTFPPWCNAAGMFPLVWGMQQEEAIGWRLSQILLFFLRQRWPICFTDLKMNATTLCGSCCACARKRSFTVSHSCFLFGHRDICIIVSLVVVQLCKVQFSQMRLLTGDIIAFLTVQRLHLDVKINASSCGGFVCFLVFN